MDDDKFYDEVNSTTYQDYDEFKISNALRRCDVLVVCNSELLSNMVLNKKMKPFKTHLS